MDFNCPFSVPFIDRVVIECICKFPIVEKAYSTSKTLSFFKNLRDILLLEDNFCAF